MKLALFTPLLYFLGASVLTIISFRLRKRNRVLLLSPILLLSFLSLLSARNLSWPIGANSIFASLVVAYIPYSIKLLALDEHPVSPESSTHKWSFVNYYRIWNNPRNLPLRLSLTDGSTPRNPKSRVSFAAKQLAKAALLWAFDHFIFQRILVHTFRHVEAMDFSPETEFPTPNNVLFLPPHALQVRAVISFHWIWAAFYSLESSHSLLAIVFVSVLGFDQPEEWPPLYNYPRNATSIRGFWGQFWHTLPIPMYKYYAQLITRRLPGLRQGSDAEKTATAFIIFTMSGVSHSLVGWSLGDAGLERDVLFFWVNFLIGAGETFISKAEVLRGLKERALRMPASCRTLVGMAYVFGFFFGVTPLWMYPKIRHAFCADEMLKIRVKCE